MLTVFGQVHHVAAGAQVGRERPADLWLVVDDEKQIRAILRAYLKRWAFEVGAFFDGVDGDASAAELARIAPNHPVFHLSHGTQ